MHIPYSYVFDSSTDRASATGFTEKDLGKWARQLSDESFWMLRSISPIEWSYINDMFWDVLEGGSA